jgi:hypothetical protein
MSTFVRYRRDPHEVYGRIIPHLDGLEHAALVARWGASMTSSSYLLRAVILLLGDLGAFVQCLRLRRSVIVIREFSSWTWLWLAPILKIVNPGAHVYLNINHNLNNKFERQWLMPVLSKLYKLGFIEPANAMLKDNPWITPLRIAKRPHSSHATIRRAYFFLGNRSEQLLLTRRELEIVLSGLPSDLERVIAGGAEGDRISEEEFQQAFMPGSLIALLYNPKSYGERHSGVVLEALVSGCPIIMLGGALGDEYLRRGFSVSLIDRPEDLPSAISSLTDRASK